MCTVWQHREAVCDTWFCKYSAGPQGTDFWIALQTYLRRVERRLTQHAVRVLAPHLVEPPRRPDQLSLEELSDRPPVDAEYGAIWAGWEGHEEAFYRAAHDVVARLSREAFDGIVGADCDELRNLQTAFAQIITPPLPSRVMLFLHGEPRPVDDGVYLGTFNTYDPVKVSTPIYEALRALRSDETVAEFRGRMLRERNLDVAEEVLMELHRVGVLLGG
jgi:hypothetical protein